MSLYGCECLNILIHVQHDVPHSDSLPHFRGVELTLDGVLIQQHTLVKTKKVGEWKVYRCKVCNVESHGEQRELVILSDSAIDCTETVTDIRGSVSYSTAFNLVIPAQIKTEDDLGEVQAATGDILLLDCSAERIKEKLQQNLDEKIKEFIKAESEKLRTAQEQVDTEKVILSRIIKTSYHADMHSMLEEAMADVITEKKEERRVMFQDNPVSPIPHHIIMKSKAPQHRVEPAAEESTDLFNFDLDSGVDNIDFLDDQDDTSTRSDSESSEDEELSSGCEADMGDITGKSLPINIPMRSSIVDIPDLPAGSLKDIAHSMKLIQNMYLQDQPDLPRHNSYNPRLR